MSVLTCDQCDPIWWGFFFLTRCRRHIPLKDFFSVGRFRTDGMVDGRLSLSIKETFVGSECLLWFGRIKVVWVVFLSGEWCVWRYGYQHGIGFSFWWGKQGFFLDAEGGVVGWFERKRLIDRVVDFDWRWFVCCGGLGLCFGEGESWDWKAMVCDEKSSLLFSFLKGMEDHWALEWIELWGLMEE